jgi:hypothetical protein
MRAQPVTVTEVDTLWNLPARGPVAMYCLVFPDCRRGLDLHDLCCRLPLLHRQECYRAPAARCPPSANCLHSLFAFLQLDDSRGPAIAEERESALLRRVVAADDAIGAVFLAGTAVNGAT